MKRIGWAYRKLGIAITLLVCVGMTVAFAAPLNGRSVKLRQPDGSKVELKAFGDEFYSWLETAEGHVVVRDPQTRRLNYAKLSANGDEFESTGIAVGKEQDKVKKVWSAGRARSALGISMTWIRPQPSLNPAPMCCA